MATTEIAPAQMEALVENRACQMNCWYFMVRHGKVLTPPPGVGVEDFQPWPHLKSCLDLILGNRLVLLGKARQVGVSWLLALYALWVVTYQKGASVLILSKGQVEAAELLARIRLAWRELPPELRQTLGADQAMMLTFPDNDAKIRVLPATQDAGVGETATLVICDEWDLHPYAGANYAILKPTIDAGGQFIGASAFYKTDMETFFKRMWRSVPDNGFAKLFLPWDVRPGRTQAWYDEVKRTFLSVDQFLGQYPTSEAEALMPPQELTFFDGKALLSMPVLPAKQGIIKPKQVGRRYCAGWDPAGEGEDRHSLHILDCGSGEVVAHLAENGPIELFTQKGYNLLESYGSPLLGLEDNGVGKATRKLMEALGYTRFYYSDKARSRMWLTNTLTRPHMLINLAIAVREGAVVIYDQETVKEMLEFTREMKAPGGRHDDRVFSLAITWQMRNEVPKHGGMTVFSGTERR